MKRLLLISALFAFSIACEEEDPPPTDTCQPADCGPAPGAPAVLCDDGETWAGVAECVPTDDGCGWELIECPEPPTCEPEDCGPAPGAPAVLCEDGVTWEGPGECVPADDGTCGWEWIECPPDPDPVPECGPDDCGPPLGMPNYLCEDGETWAGPGECVPADEGGCGWEILECPEPPPTPAP